MLSVIIAPAGKPIPELAEYFNELALVRLPLSGGLWAAFVCGFLPQFQPVFAELLRMLRVQGRG